MVQEVHFSSKSAEWYTPAPLVEAARQVFQGEITLDPASSAAANEVVQAWDYFDRDGLSRNWISITLWMNPPYGRQIGKWVEKLAKAYQEDEFEQALALLPARTDTRWWRHIDRYPVCFLHGRVKFWSPDGRGATAAPFPSAVVALGVPADRFYSAFYRLGRIYKPEIF